MNVPSGYSTNPPHQQPSVSPAPGATDRLMQMLLGLDDQVQAMGRNVYSSAANALGDRFGYDVRDSINDIGQLVHADRRAFDGTGAQQAELMATRALQAGGLTVAGANLLNLANAFGGGADQPEPGTLYM